MTDATSLSIKIADRADKIARDVLQEINIHCGGHPEFAAIMLHAVETKIMAFRHAAQQKAARS